MMCLIQKVLNYSIQRGTIFQAVYDLKLLEADFL